MDLVQRLQMLQINATSQDFSKPESDRLQAIYRSILVRAFGVDEHLLTQISLDALNQDLQSDRDLYVRTESNVLLLRYMQGLLNDFTIITDDSPQLSMRALIDPQPRETRLILKQLFTIYDIKQRARPHYEREVEAMDLLNSQLNNDEVLANELESKVAKLKAERQTRLRLDHQLRETKEKRNQRCAQLGREASEGEEKNKYIEDEVRRHTELLSSKDDELCVLNRQSHSFDYEMIDNPKELKDEVEHLRTMKISQQKLVDDESRICKELSAREENCRQCDRIIETINEEMRLAQSITNRLDEQIGLKTEEEAKYDETDVQLKSRKESVEKKKNERLLYMKSHEDEKEDKKERMKSLTSKINDIQEESNKLKSIEGKVKKNVGDARNTLNRIKNEKHNFIQEKINYVEERTELVNIVEKKLNDKKVWDCVLMKEYKKGMISLDECYNSSDLDVSVTATMTYNLLS